MIIVSTPMNAPSPIVVRFQWDEKAMRAESEGAFPIIVYRCNEPTEQEAKGE